MLANFFLIRAHGQTHLRFVGDDVVLGAGLDVAHRNDRGFAGMDFAGDDRLQSHGDAGGNQHRVDGRLGPRPVPAFAINSNANGIGSGLRKSWRNAHLTNGDAVFIMHRHADVRLGKFLEQSVIDHLLRTGDDLFRRLPNQHQRSVPSVFTFRHDGGRAVERSHVHVVPASVHHADIAAAIIFGFDFARVGQAGLFGDRQRVKFGAQHHRRTCPVLHDGHHAGSPHVFRHFVSQAAKLLRHHSGGPRLV